ncbi:hypothetical protein GCM10011359_04720 [Nesterenkonia alkaliphila]|nr:hypothetical protein GCM10011359_04720 [Nesterenkonia alkaliphila]
MGDRAHAVQATCRCAPRRMGWPSGKFFGRENDEEDCASASGILMAGFAVVQDDAPTVPLPAPTGSPEGARG